MSSNALDNYRYPIGQFEPPPVLDGQQLAVWVDDIEKFPFRLNKEVANLGKKVWHQTYRPGGWTILQLVHHCADSHMNSFIRFKLALTEDVPTIKTYVEDRWANLPDATTEPAHSLRILEGLHRRWGVLLRSLTAEDRRRTFIHPETNRRISIEENIGIYAWHGNHHLAHIRLAKTLSLSSTT
ncbi:YfiT family bacillithiol transferase [Sphingobacterium suaedae]|uniref:YfiT family bacillithiol transferase n=1 Tax=Sphingobacterium suaedae TaxID=1686402 RepID=A0ABW5KJL6_9SPHI